MISLDSIKCHCNGKEDGGDTDWGSDDAATEQGKSGPEASEEEYEGSEGNEAEEGGRGQADEGGAAFDPANTGEELHFVSKITIVRPRCFDYTGFR